jgi:hypothetical protein
MKMIRVLSACVLASVLGSAYAHDGMHGPGAKYDADESGELSLTEYTAYLTATKQDVSAAAEKFAALDSNKNGSLSGKEFIVGMPKAPVADTKE